MRIVFSGQALDWDGITSKFHNDIVMNTFDHNNIIINVYYNIIWWHNDVVQFQSNLLAISTPQALELLPRTFHPSGHRRGLAMILCFILIFKSQDNDIGIVIVILDLILS